MAAILKLGDHDPVEDELLDRSIVEECVPCHILWTVAQGLVADGIKLRPDVWHQLSVGAAVPLRHVRQDTARVQRLCRRIDEVCTRVLRGFPAGGQEHALYVVATFVLKLVDERLLADAQNMGVLISLLLMDELREEGGENIVVRDSVLKAEAGRLLDLVRREGLYPGPVQRSALANTVPAGRA